MAENPVVGVWKLVSCDAIRAVDVRLPIYGKHPIGLLYYDATGNMSVHIMKSDRRHSSSNTKFGATESEMKAAYEGYEAYFSRYTLDTERQTISHRVVGSLFPNWTGTVQRRYYAFDGNDRLILSTQPIGSTPMHGPIVELVWERIR